MRRFLPFLLLLPLFLLNAPTVHAADAWVCPMHCEGDKTYPKPGKCPVCGMTFIKAGEPEAPDLNSRDYRVDLTLDPKSPVAGHPTELTLVPRFTKDGAVVKDLEKLHDTWVLATVVSQDLGWLTRVHPQRQADGSVKLSLTFPSGGDYILYAEFTPKKGQRQVFPLTITVEGPKKTALPLKPGPREEKLPGGFRVALKSATDVPVGKHTDLIYRIAHRDSVPKVMDCLVISEDTTQFARIEPREKGSEVICPARFYHSGLYKTWLEWSDGKQMHTADFVVNAR